MYFTGPASFGVPDTPLSPNLISFQIQPVENLLYKFNIITYCITGSVNDEESFLPSMTVV